MTLFTGPAPASAAPTPAGPSSFAVASINPIEDDGLPTWEWEKVLAARTIDIEPDEIWLGKTDCLFVFKIWQNAANFPVIRDAAELVLTADSENSDVVCRAFIRVGIFDAKKADNTKKIAEETAARQARDLRRAAYAAAGVAIDADGQMLLKSERDTVFEIFTKAAGARVKAAADAALKAGSEAEHSFLASGVMTAADQDVQDAIKASGDQSEATKARIAREGALRAAAAVLGVVADSGKLVMSDDDFIRWIWETVDATNRIEIRAAAERALRSSDHAVWRAFIDTGIHAANKADLDRQLAEKEAADRRLAESIKAQAVTDGFDNLLTAATQALIANPSDLDDFVRIGQYQVAVDDANRPSKASWEWRNVNSDQCLGLKNGSTSDGSPLQQRGCVHADDQLWIGMRVYNSGGRYRLISAKDRTKCVSLADGSSAFVVRTCDGKADQFFYYKKVSDNYIWISEQVNRAITIQGASRDAGAPAITADVNDATNQQWFGTGSRLSSGQRLEEARVLHTQTGITLNLQPDGNLVIYKGPRAIWASNTTNGARFLNQPDGNLVIYRADNTSVWASNTAGNGPSTLQLQDDGNLVLYRNKDSKAIWSTNVFDVPIASTLSGKCIDVNGSTFEAGTRLQTWTCNSSSAQKWIALGETLLSLNNKCAEVAGGSKANGAVLQLGTCNGSGGQRFVFNANGNLVNPQSGRCVDIPNADRGDGIQLQIRDCVTTAVSQKWRRL
ncbi:ricin-type beta-trefoil lectin domain protein [Actinoplanes palleronii]|nr:ricin-type beta-trefoil lectin domain protein [Actinoplanes palleronii]